LAEAQQRRAVHLGVAADVVVRARMERLAHPVEPLLARLVAILEEHGARVPVLLLARQEVAALEQQDAQSGGSEAMDERAAARAGADDDDVVVLHGVACHEARQKPQRKMQRWSLSWWSFAQRTECARAHRT